MPHTHPTRHALLYTLSLLTLIILGFLNLNTSANPTLQNTPSRFSRRQIEEEPVVEPIEPDVPDVDVPEVDIAEVDLEPPLAEEEGELADPLPPAPDTPADPGFDISKPAAAPATPAPGISLITSCTTFTVAAGKLHYEYYHRRAEADPRCGMGCKYISNQSVTTWETWE